MMNERVESCVSEEMTGVEYNPVPGEDTTLLAVASRHGGPYGNHR